MGTFFASVKAKRLKEADDLFISDHAKWERDARERYERHKRSQADYTATVARLRQEHPISVQTWENERDEYLAKRDRANAAIDEQHAIGVKIWEIERDRYLASRDRANAMIDQKRERYLAGDPNAVYDYCEIVLSRSEYPDLFPKSYELEYNPENRILIVDYALPPLDNLPTLQEVCYNASRDEFTEKRLTESQAKDLYDSVLYQTTLRTIHELLQADQGDVLDAVVFNGVVTSLDPAIGRKTTKYILSLQAFKKEFMEVNLAAVHTKACFRKRIMVFQSLTD